MKRKRRVSILITTLLLVSMLLPVLTYAMTASFSYDSSNNRLSGSIYTKDPNSVKVEKNVGGVISTLNGVSVSTETYNDANELYYSISYSDDGGNKPTSFKVSDSSLPQGATITSNDNYPPKSYYTNADGYERLSSFRMSGSQNSEGLAPNSFLQPTATLLNFTPTQSLSDTIMLLFPANESLKTTINFGKLTPGSFTLTDNTTNSNTVISNVYQPYEYDYINGIDVLSTSKLELKTSTPLLKDHSYTLKMSATSQGNEIQLPGNGLYDSSAYLGTLLPPYQTPTPAPIPTATPTPTPTPTGYGSVSGLITNVDQTPIEGAKINLYLSNSFTKENLYASALTNANGIFTFDHIPVGEIYYSAAKKGLISVSTSYTLVKTDSPTTLNSLRMVVSGLTGSIQDLNGIAIRDANISTVVSGVTINTNSNNDGSFFIDNLPDGEHLLTITKEGYQTTTVSSQDIYHGYYNSIGKINMISTPPIATPAPTNSGSLKGSVKGFSSGLAIAGVEVSLYLKVDLVLKFVGTTLTDSLGAYSFNNVPAGKVSLYFYKSGYYGNAQYSSTSVRANTETVVNSFSIVSSYLSGFIKNSNNNGIENAKVTLSGTNYHASTYQGSFTFFDVPSGDYNLTISKIGYDDLTTTEKVHIQQSHFSSIPDDIILVSNSDVEPIKYRFSENNSIFFDNFVIGTIPTASPTPAPTNNNTTITPPIVADGTTPSPIPTKSQDVVTADPNGGSKITPIGVHEKSPTGGDILNVTIEASTFTQALEQIKDKSKDDQSITIDLGNSKTDISNISLSASLITNALVNHQDVVLTIISNDVTYDLPIKLLDLASLSKALGSDAANAKITISIEKITGAAGDKINAEAKTAGFEAIGNAIDFKITIEANGVKKEINDFGSTYVSRTLTLPQVISSNTASAVLYDPTTGQFSFVPATFSTVDGKTTITIKRNGNSQYLIVSSDKSFADTANMYAADDISLLASKLIVNGVTATEFKPYNKVTRAEFTALLVRALGLSLDTSASSFSDIKASDWYASAISTGSKAGLINGFEDGTFRPNDSITREQMANLISKALTLTGKVVNVDGQIDQIISKFADNADISAWATSGTAKVTQAGIMQGSAGSFSPDTFADRAQAAVTIKRLLKYLDFIN
ncbi:carboxypeptidase regulatory-like domain-containing protein [Paenibacillus psychroresistens]|nr:carboxypeptidase regulatory-like domain-containing protein [Paenibacillus psychroresistens]